METLTVERDGGVVTVTMNRPEKKNALNHTMWHELRQTFHDVATRPDDRVMVLTGAGGEFCSGTDLSALGHTETHPLVGMRTVTDAVLALHRLPKPTIARVAGVAVGAGCNLALGCDLVVAAETARFCEIFSRRGLSMDGGGSWLLPRLVGLHRAKEIAFFADMLSAAEAAAFGLVNRVVAIVELDAVVGEWAQRLAGQPPLALSMTKTMLHRSFETTVGQALEEEARCQAVNLMSADANEAIEAFLAKRTPQFGGMTTPEEKTA